MNSQLLELFYKLKKFNTQFKNNKLRFVTNNSVYESNFFYTYLLQQCELLKESPYKDILFNYLIKSERIYPGSSYYVTEKLLNILNGNNNKNKKIKTENNIENFKKYLDNVSTSKEYADLFLSILNFSGPDATLSCKPTDNVETTIIKKNNTKFDISIHESFRGIYFSNQKETTKQFIISVMDVYIEKESEIMTLINYSYEQKMPILLICRGISDFAINALKNIILRNNIFVYPYIAKFDNEDPFLLQDISNALDVNLFALDAGDSLYSSIVEKTNNKKLKLKSDSIEIFDINKSLVKKINEQIKNADQDLKKYLLKRKNRISPNIVEINIPKDKTKFISEIRSLIRCYNNCILYGLLKDENEIIYSRKEDLITEKLSGNLYNTLLNIGYTIRKDNNV
tara:strand:+ start:20043 stop:21236 length:1194 start_codon:yes stop_codon:yes gene_type:complete